MFRIAACAALLLPTAVPAQTMVILAPRAFAPALRDYAAARSRELPCEIAVLEDVLAAATGADDPERIKRFLHTRWLERNLRYVLLAGDCDVLPVRYMVLDRVTPAAFDHAFYPSDLYYADVAHSSGSFDDWNGSRDGFHAAYFGEVRGEKNKDGPINADRIDYRPELAVGRWPVSNVEELAIVIAKSLAHAARRADPVARAAWLAVDGWVDSRPALHEAGQLLQQRFTVTSAAYGTGGPEPDSAFVLAQFQHGVDLLLHAGHGSPDGWEHCLTSKMLPAFQNGSRLPVVLSAGCSTAQFATLPPYEGYTDTYGNEHRGTNQGEVFAEPPPPPAPLQHGAHDTTGLGERMLLQPDGGAIAYFGCNTGSQPCGLTLLVEFARAAGSQPMRLGDCWIASLCGYWQRERLAELRPTESWYPPSVFFQGMKFMLFGDPSLWLAARP